MDKQNLYLIGDLPGFTPQLSRLVSMLAYTRHMTLKAIDGLTISELDYLPDPGSNSIGTLLLHIAAAEVGYQASTFANRELNDDEKLEWGAVFSLGKKDVQQITGHELSWYEQKLEQVRTKTLSELSIRDDQWLTEQTSFGNMQVNNYFKWFHVMTHEVNHKGQILLLRRQIGK